MSRMAWKTLICLKKCAFQWMSWLADATLSPKVKVNKSENVIFFLHLPLIIHASALEGSNFLGPFLTLKTITILIYIQVLLNMAHECMLLTRANGIASFPRQCSLPHEATHLLGEKWTLYIMGWCYLYSREGINAQFTGLCTQWHINPKPMQLDRAFGDQARRQPSQ
jgi:hypothetical protein